MWNVLFIIILTFQVLTIKIVEDKKMIEYTFFQLVLAAALGTILGLAAISILAALNKKG